MATDEYLRWGWNQSEIFVLIEPAFTELRDTDVLKVGYHVWARNGRHVSTISLHRFNNARPRPPPPVINITGPNRRLRIFMQLTWSPFIISPGHLFNIERREFCGFSRVEFSPRASNYFPGFSICVQHYLFFACIFSPFVLAFQFVPIWPNFCISTRILSVFVWTFHAFTCPCNGTELRSRGKTLSRLFSTFSFYSPITFSHPNGTPGIPQMGRIPSKVVNNGSKCCK